ncbi:hypothetical protein QVD17_25233 [Tagetes erecta]|uniref:Large ribosomal subunit protein bL31c n=1 Tax=Tagetes erecta TaxID=13708 RepID=A0AAD8NV08_TARER|nr:hypothetical protein QVD17_25233 [Tagetes erecta]
MFVVVVQVYYPCLKQKYVYPYKNVQRIRIVKHISECPILLKTNGILEQQPTHYQWSCRKKDIHPEFYNDAKVSCNGEHVLTTGGTKKEYVVDVWSGNHPFNLGTRSANLTDADQVEKFRKKFGGLDEFMQIPTLKGEIVIPTKRIVVGDKEKKKKKKK